MSKKSQKGTSLIVVFIVCTVISMLLATSFIVLSNYNSSVLLRKKDLYEKVKENKLLPKEETSKEGE